MGEYFDDIHSMPINEIGRRPHKLEDTERIKTLRNTKTYSGLMALGDAFCRQLRYREAIEAYSRAVELEPNDPEAYRQRAARYIATLQPKKAVEDLVFCYPFLPKKADTLYRMGIAHYLDGNYAEAMRCEKTAYERFDDEMGIAAMYWNTLSAFRSHSVPTLLGEYRDNMEVGHHTAYRLAMRTASGRLDIEDALKMLKKIDADLEYAMAAYGIAVFADFIGEEKLYRELVGSVVKRDSFWICYGYLAAWNDTH